MSKSKPSLRSNDGTGGTQITVAHAGQRGGRSTLQRHGVEFFRKIGRRGGTRTAELHRSLFKQFGATGGRPKRPTFTQDMGEKGHH